jgi:ABC-type amino acid transport substrate-binding protein
LKGFDIDIGNALCAEMKAKCTWVKQEWDGMIPALMARKFDAIVASMSITAERKAKVDFTNKYYASPVVLIAKTGSPLRPELASLKGKKVAVQRGTVSDNFATKYWDGKGVEVVRYGKQDEAYLDLKSGRVDATFADYWEAYGGFLTKPEGSGYRLPVTSTSARTPKSAPSSVKASALPSARRTRTSRRNSTRRSLRCVPMASTTRSARSTSRWTSTATDVSL